jgi:hypothetical protein
VAATVGEALTERGHDASHAARGDDTLEGPGHERSVEGPGEEPPSAGTQIGPDGNLGTGCSGMTAKDSELSNPDEAAAADDAVESSDSRRSTDVESGVETLALSAAPEMAGTWRPPRRRRGTRTLSGRT